MKSKKIIFVLLFQVLLGTLLASNPEDIANELKFEPVVMDYEEGIRNVVTINEIHEDDNGVFWLGSINGLYRFNGSSALNITERINSNQSNLVSSFWITAIANDKTNRIWFGTTIGLYVYDQQTDKCILIPLEDTANTTPNNAYINKITFHNEMAFIGTRDGIYEVDTNTFKVRNSYMTKGKPHHERGTKSTIYCILPQVETNNLWFTSRLGLHRMTPTRQIDSFLLREKNENADHFFLGGVILGEELFLADYKHGIVRFNLDSESVTNYHIGDTKWSRTKSIIHLEEGLFLINAEHKGMAVFDSDSGQYHWLDTNGKTKASFYNLFKDSHGYLWFATNGEFFRSNMVFQAQEMLRKRSLDIANAFANGKKLNNLLGQPTMLNLDHTENNLQVNFCLTDKWRYPELTYQYQIYNKDWIDIIEKNKLNLFDLPAGKHELKIRARNGEDVIAASSVHIEVHRPFTSSPLFYSIMMLGLIGLSTAVYFYNKRQYQAKLRIKSQYETRLAALESQALRSQINPHFIFNTLNSIKYYSIEKSPEETSDFISSFSTLIRRILENSKKNLITLHEEIETLQNYTEIETLRFHEHFYVEYKVDSNIETEQFLVPPMIIQPFIENAIWHGLMHKSDNRKLQINFKQKGNGVVCEIIDNGIGRKASNALKSDKNHKTSLGMKITKERMDIINTRNLMNNSFEIKDLIDENGSPTGTNVSIYFQPKENN